MEEDFEKLLPIFHKVASSSNQISRAEKNVLQYRPSPQEEDAAVHARTSCKSLLDLIQMCLTDGVSLLTADELEILSEGVQPALLSTANAMSSIQERQPADIQALIEQVYQIISDASEDQAMLVATEEIHRRAQA